MRPSRILSDLNQMLAAAGIGEPMRTRLLSLPHIDRPYLRAHLRRAKAEKTDTALLIYRLLHADHAPDTSQYYDPCRSCSQVRPWDHLCPVCSRCYECCECADASEGNHEGEGGERDIHEAGNTCVASTALKETVLAQVCDAASPVAARGEENARDVVRSRIVELARAMGRGPPRANTFPEAPSHPEDGRHRFDGRFLGRSAQQVQPPTGSQIPRTSASHR